MTLPRPRRRTATIEGVMANYENALQAARSLWVSSDSVSRALYAAKDAGRDRIHADGPATVEAAAP
jgi:hypothetical protein